MDDAIFRVKLANSRISAKQLATEYGVSVPSVYNWRRAAPAQPKRGIASFFAEPPKPQEVTNGAVKHAPASQVAEDLAALKRAVMLRLSALEETGRRQRDELGALRSAIEDIFSVEDDIAGLLVDGERIDRLRQFVLDR